MKQGQKTTKLRIHVCNNAEWLREHVAGEVWEAARDGFTDDELRQVVNGAIHDALLDLERREGWELTLDDNSGWHDWNGRGHTAHSGISTHDDLDAGQDARLSKAVCEAIDTAMNMVS